MWVIVILIIIPFALWGVNEYFGPQVNIAVANVNGNELTQREFRNSYQRQRQRLQAMLGDQFDVNQLDENRLKRETLEGMINEEILIQVGMDNGLLIGDEQLAGIIRAMEPFQEDGQFSQERYEYRVRNQGYVPGGFEYSFRRALLTAQIHAGIASSEFVSPAELENVIRLREQKRSFSYMTIPMAMFMDSAEVTEESISEHYRGHQDAFIHPEQVQIEYIELSMEKIAEGIDTTEDELARRFETQKGNYVTPGQRQASHILLKLQEDASEDEVASVQGQAATLIRQIRDGASFEELAKTHSQDPGSAKQGGDLGLFGRGMMVKPFEDAAFSMAEGEISEPIRSSFGIHIIKLTGIREGGVRSFAEVKREVRREVQLDKAEKQFFEQAEQFSNLVFENPDTLEIAADALGLSISESGLFSRKGGSGIGAEKKVINAAFSEEVLQGNNSEPLELSGTRIVALRIKQHISATQRPLEDVRDEIIQALKSGFSRDKAKGTGTVIVNRLRSSESPELIAREYSLSWSSKNGVRRTEQGMDTRILNKAFQLGHPEGGPIFGGVSLLKGDYAVISLTEVKDGEVPDGSKDQQTFQQRLQRAQGEEVYQALIKSLRSKADIEIYKGEF
ncbi:MAG: peptidylprolyl isomerase [Gammaproteobacteria bacterium]|nr:peptidylprolyl isomerase [Gammaproteobacteria bacterium]